MATTDTTYIILFSANLAFIVTHLYGWLLKWFYKPEAYREHFHELFPACGGNLAPKISRSGRKKANNVNCR